jgi:aspartate/glutamate racemase
MLAWETGDFDAVRGTLARGVERLARSGADFFACPENTAHLALERPGPELGCRADPRGLRTGR